jgi:hypothetical protein
VYARRRRRTNRGGGFFASTAAGWRTARHKHDRIDNLPIDARLVELAERQPKHVENGACRRRAVCREQLRRAERRWPRPSSTFRWWWWWRMGIGIGIGMGMGVGVAGIVPCFAGEELDGAEGAVR